MGRIGYRTGDLSRKAEDVTQLVDRGTGYFGTGYYFTTTPERCMQQGSSQERPLYRLTFKDDVRWLRGTRDLHDDLKDFHRYMFMYPMYRDTEFLDKIYRFAKATDMIYDGRDNMGKALKAEWDYYREEYGANSWEEFYTEDYAVKSILAVADNCTELKEFAELLRHYDRETGKPDFGAISLWTREHANYFNSNSIREYKHTAIVKHATLPISFGITESRFDEICRDIYEIYKDDYSEGMFKPWRRTAELSGLDSFPTLLVKALGYDGIWPAEECDNIEYGGIIYSADNIANCKQIVDVATEWDGER